MHGALHHRNWSTSTAFFYTKTSERAPEVPQSIQSVSIAYNTSWEDEKHIWPKILRLNNRKKWRKNNCGKKCQPDLKSYKCQEIFEYTWPLTMSPFFQKGFLEENYCWRRELCHLYPMSPLIMWANNLQIEYWCHVNRDEISTRIVMYAVIGFLKEYCTNNACQCSPWLLPWSLMLYAPPSQKLAKLF